jgi:type III pantothenate kinase
VIAKEPDAEGSHAVLMSIGNSRVSLATWSDGRRSDAHYVPTRPIDPVVELLQQHWQRLPAGDARPIVIGSVNPPALAEVRSACAARRIAPLLVVGEDMLAPIEADVDEPAKVGTDRLCAAAAAFEKVKSVCVVADFGTALTIDLVSDNGVFLGGTILPGVAMSARALHEQTAQLPLVDVAAPTETLGKNTASAIINGIFAMMVGALREVTERYATEIGRWPPLVVTGGDAAAIAKACDFVDRVVPDLVLDGLALAYRKHVGPGEPDLE